jgi:surface protein
MFFGAVRFNQPLNDWNVSNVTNMSYMFKDAESFSEPLDDWAVSEGTDMTNFMREYETNQNDSVIQLSAMYSSFRSSIQREKTALENSSILVETTDTVMDYISGEEITITDLLTNPENIVFYYQRKPSFFITREQLLPNLNEYIRFGCLHISHSLLPRVENLEAIAYVALRPLGFPLAEGMVPLFQLNNALYPESPKSVCLEITETEKIFPSVVSLQMLGNEPNAVSAAHCQEGQQQKVYELKQINYPSQTAGRRTRKIKGNRIRNQPKKTHKKKKNNIKRKL